MVIYTVQTGDTLYSISQRFGVSPQRVITDNSLTEPKSLTPGQSLLLLTPAVSYTAVQGDTLSSIASRYGVTVPVLLQNNPNLTLNPTLHIGQQLTIHFTAGKLRRIVTNGFTFDTIDPDTLCRTLPYLTYLTIHGYGFTPEGRLIPPADQPLLSLAQEYGTVPIMLLTDLTEDGRPDPRRSAQLFHDRALQERVLLNALTTMEQKGYRGLNLSFERIPTGDSDSFLNFLGSAAEQLHNRGYLLHTDLAPRASDTQQGLLYSPHDYASIGALADSVHLLTDESPSAPSALSPLNQSRRVAEYCTSNIAPDKILLSIPGFGLDWPLPFERGASQASPIGHEYAVDLARRHSSQILTDPSTQTPSFTYTRDGLQHTAWFEDVRSIENRFSLIDELNLSGCASWNIMRPFQQSWSYIAARYSILKL